MRLPFSTWILLCSTIGMFCGELNAQEQGFDLEVDERYQVAELLEMEEEEELHKDTGKTVVVTGIVKETGMSHNMETGEFLTTVLLKAPSGEDEGETLECLPKDEDRVDALKEGMKVKVAGELAEHVGARVRYARFRILEE